MISPSYVWRQDKFHSLLYYPAEQVQKVLDRKVQRIPHINLWKTVFNPSNSAERDNLKSSFKELSHTGIFMKNFSLISTINFEATTCIHTKTKGRKKFRWLRHDYAPLYLFEILEHIKLLI